MSKLFKVIIFALILFSVISVFLTVPFEDNFAKTADEGRYFAYASLVNKEGPSVFPGLAKMYINDENARLYPPPSRIWHILMTALCFKILPNTFVSLAQFSLLCFILFLLTSFYFSRKIFGEDEACLFTLIMASSPLMMAMARRALSDMHGNLLWALAVWLFLDFLNKDSVIKYFAFIVFFSLSILVRESSVILSLFFVTAFFVAKYGYKRGISNVYLLGAIALPAVIVGLVYIIVFQGVPNALEMIRAVLSTHTNFAAQTSRYALLFCTGPWYRYILDYLLLSPITLILFIGYFCHKTAERKIEWPTAYFMIYFAAAFGILSGLKYSKVVRFVINLDMVIGLFSVLFLYELFRQKDPRKQALFVFLAAVGIFFINYSSFIDIFCINGVYDPVSYCLLSIRRFIP